MNFGFQEIDGEEVGLLETYAYRQDFRINVEIMKARDKLLRVCQITTDNAARAPIRAEFWIKKDRLSLLKTMGHQVYAFRTKQGNQWDAFQEDTVC